MGGYVEIHEPGCDSPTPTFAGQLLITPLPDHNGRQALRQARQRALIVAAAADDNPATAGRCAIEEVTLIIAAWARVFDSIERGGGSISYRARP